VHCCIDPAVREGLTGVTAMETSVGVMTVIVVDAVMEPEVALMVVAPAVRAVATPAALMVATLVVEEVHAAELVRFCVVPLL